ncbi:MAG TPA: ATP-dependent RNA helicase HrpA [Ilumatobacteraceae bacterium]|nr:ATP-dependent RNA helicase HrpA [Ilumatobacteraceae bacterium]
MTDTTTDTTEHPRAAAARAIQGRLAYPDALPITERRDEILDAIRDHQVVIVAGETGSGKSTQLPKLCLEAGRGVAGMIGHTQPRRVAARTIAERVAEEVGSKLGDDVGYTVRFTDQVGESTLVKVMTDGILLAEIQRDRMLRRYDTLIIDEAHERSLNIDFILGYLRQLLPQRPDLKVIVTSATIDTARFADHFAQLTVPAPVIEVTGRTFPVELRYRPLVDDESDEPDRDQVQGILDAVEELSHEGPGDVLVFLSGEREIHDTADALRQLNLRSTEVLPLYARLSSAEQHKIFERAPMGGPGRRIVLATNVAETSLTVPGVRYVVDTGTARISRYSRRLKVQRLPIEPVSQASANQRAGRCGRVAPGICIRLYGEDDFESRPEFTDPEILRTNLASVILQMTAIGLGDVAKFPFVEPPDRHAIRDGYGLLDELAALQEPADGVKDGPRKLTKIGRSLARLPVDPRLGRMVLEADRLGCVREVLVIASALSIQDPRERPQDKREQANEFHNRFKVDGSDLLSIVALWDYLRTQQRELSGNQFRRMCRKEFLNYLRVREWMDLFSQLRRIAGQLKIRPTTHESHPDHIHQAVLAGLLSHIGMRDRETREFIGARQSRFVIAPGSALTRRPSPWVMAAELVETNQLYARRVAKIEPKWAERAGAHLVKRSYDNVRWDPKGGRAVATEQVTLYGLPIVSDRVIGYDRVDEAQARAWFITKALIERDVADTAWIGRQKFLTHNAEFLEHLRRMAARVRRLELVDDEMLFDFYADRVGPEVTSLRHFDRWWKAERQRHPDLLELTDDLVAGGRGHGVHLADYPDVWTQQRGSSAIELPLTYRFAPGEPLDGVTVHVPLSGLNQVSADGFDWQIPGHRADLVSTLVKSLPKDVRRQLIPLGETIEAVLDRLATADPTSGLLVDALAAAVREVAHVNVTGASFVASVVPDHLRVHFVVSDDEGTVHAVGDDLDAIKTQLAGSARESIAAAAPIEERRGIVSWDVGDLPRVVESTDRTMDVKAYPALLDVGDSVALRVVTTPELQQRIMRGGVRRLLLLNGAPTRSSIVRKLDNADRLAIAAGDIDLGAVSGDCVAAAVDFVMADHGSLPWTDAEFESLRRAVRDSAPGLAANALHKAARVIGAASEARDRLARLHAAALRPSVDDANVHLGRLVHPGFVLGAGIDRLDDIERYVRAIVYRLDHLAGAGERDQRRMAEVRPLEQRYANLVDTTGPGKLSPELVDVRWQLEEFRVATFAQPLMVKRPGQPPVSAKRISATLAR